MNSSVVGLGETPRKCSGACASVSESEVNGDSTSDLKCVRKRENYLPWADYFMSIACLSAKRSKDPNTQVGACIVNPENKIVGIGYNGMPIGCSDDLMPWGKDDDDMLNTKYPYVCHAEMNAIMNKNSADVKGCRIYTVLFPCNECAKLIVQAGIRQIIYINDRPTKPEYIASKRILDSANVRYEHFVPKRQKVVIDFSHIADGTGDPSLDGSSSGGAKAAAGGKNLTKDFAQISIDEESRDSSKQPDLSGFDYY